METIEKSHVADDDHILDDDTYSELKKILEDPTAIDTHDISNEEFAIEFKKEFSLSDEEYKDLKETLGNPNTIDTSSIEDEKFKRYIKLINDDEYKNVIDFSLKSIMNDILYDIFPFYGFFIDKCGETVWKSVIRTMFYVGKDATPLNVVKGIFMATGGELRLATLIKEKPYLIFIGKNDIKNLNLHKSREFFKMQKLKSNDYLFSYFGQKAEDKGQRLNQEKLAQEYKGTTRKLITLRIGIEFAKNAGKAVISNLAKAGFNFFLDSAYTSSYEQQKRSYELILHKYFTNKFNDAYAVKNISYEPYSNETSEYIYYPIEIYSSFINIDLKRTIIGGRLSSGGLDYHNFFYYDINTTTNKLDSNLSKDISLDTMISYLCLDELRTDNKTDEEFFNNLNKRNKKLAYSPKELMLQGVKTLLTISPSNPIGIKQREKIYDLYSQGVEEGTELPIDKYNEAMEILEDFKNGNLNTFGSEVDNKSRRLLKALDVIGNNNVKGMYVGCKIEHGKKSVREIPPRLIGRLATTIIMEDGLYIG